MGKFLKEKRMQNFKENYLPKLKEEYQVFEEEHYFIIDNTRFGTLNFYPKSGKLLIRKDNRWIEMGLNWIINNLLT